MTNKQWKPQDQHISVQYKHILILCLLTDYWNCINDYWNILVVYFNNDVFELRKENYININQYC